MTAVFDIHPLDVHRREDFLRFFDEVAFTDNAKWDGCYCQCYYEDHRIVIWHDRTAADNRTRASMRIEDRTMQGCLAYAGGEVVGWCSAAPRPLVHALDPEPIEDADAIGVITCFVVAPRWRKQGVARALLDGALDSFRAQGLRFAEANPRADAKTAAEHHFGPPGLFLKAGFVAVRQDPDDGSMWLRKTL